MRVTDPLAINGSSSIDFSVVVDVVVVVVAFEADRLLILFLAMSRSSGESFLVVVGIPVVVDTVDASATDVPSLSPPEAVVDVDTGAAVVVVVVVGAVLGANGDRPKMGNLGRGFLVAKMLGRAWVGLSV